MSDQPNDWFVRFFQEHRIKLRRYLSRIVSSSDIAEDLTQEAFARIYAVGADNLEAPKNFLFRTGHNLARDHIRRLKRSPTVPIDDSEAENVESSEPSAERQVASKEELEIISTALDELPAKCRTALTLLRVRGWSYREVAREMQLSETMVRNYVIRALEYCQARLDGDEPAGVRAPKGSGKAGQGANPNASSVHPISKV